MTGSEKRATLEHVLHVPGVDHRWVSASKFCDEYHAVEVTNCIDAAKKRTACVQSVSVWGKCIPSIYT